MGRKMSSRGTAGGEFGSITGDENEEWETMRINDWPLALNAGITSHVFVSPFDIFAIRM